MEVTEEMRRAVYAADCEAQGHMWDTSRLIGQTDDPLLGDGVPATVVRAPDPDQLPHLACRRCDLVWLLMDEPGHGYDAALAQAQARVGGAATTPPDAFQPRLPRGVHSKAERAEREQAARELGMGSPYGHGHGQGQTTQPAAEPEVPAAAVIEYGPKPGRTK